MPAILGKAGRLIGDFPDTHRLSAPQGAYFQDSPDFLHDRDHFRPVAFRVDRVRDDRTGMAERELGGLQAEFTSEVGRGVMEELMWVETVGTAPFHQILPEMLFFQPLPHCSRFSSSRCASLAGGGNALSQEYSIAR